MSDKTKCYSNDDLEFLSKLINMDKDYPDLTEYRVRFNDSKEELSVRARNFTVAGILAMAYVIHCKGVGYSIRWIESTRTGNKVPFDIER